MTLDPQTRQDLVNQRLAKFSEINPNTPDFSPSNGRCYCCGHDLVEEYQAGYICLIITGCSECHRSYCD